jgi:transcriptional regulator with XRE-family HTH domain
VEFSSKIKMVREKVNLNQKEFAEKLNTTQAAVSRYEKNERTPDVNFISTLLTTFEINPSWFFLNDNSIFLTSNMCYQAFLVSEQTSSQAELNTLLQDFICKESSVFKIQKIIQRIKGQNFLTKIKNLFSGEAERMLIILYAFFNYLEIQKLNIADENIHETFLNALKNFRFTSKDHLIYGILTKETDFNSLVKWAEEGLDNTSVIEIISSIPEVKEFTKTQLNALDKNYINLSEKITYIISGN